MIAPSRVLYERYRSTCVLESDDPVGMTFITSGGEVDYSWSALFAAADEFAQKLEVDESYSGQLVAILATDQEKQVIGVIAALNAGMVPAVLTPPSRKVQPDHFIRHLRGVLTSSRPRLVVTDWPPGLLDDAIDSSQSYDVVDWDGLRICSAARPSSALTLPADAVLVQFSSGTTGIKKGVAVSSAALHAQLDAYSSALKVEPTEQADGCTVVNGDCIVSWLPLYHDMGYITALHMPLERRVRTVMIDPLHWIASPNSYLDAATKYGCTLGWFPNFAFSFMADRCRSANLNWDLSRLRHLVNCSEPVTQQSQSKFVEVFSNFGFRREALTGCYAMAETTFALTHGSNAYLARIDETGPRGAGSLHHRLPMVSTGMPLPGVEIQVRDRRGKALEDGVVGEIHVSAPFLVNGYLGDEERSRSAFVDGWYATGDLGYRKSDDLYVIGREKDTIISAGHNVFPEDIERAIAEEVGVRPGRVVVFGLFDEGNQTERVVALAEPTDAAAPIDVLRIRQKLLAGFGVAVSLHKVEPGWILKSSSGKPSRAANREKWQVIGAGT